MGGLSAPERRLLGILVANEKATVNSDDIISVTACSSLAANQTLSRLCQKGWLRRVRRGLYTVVPLSSPTPDPAVEDAWPLAMALFAPGYISGWSAAEHWDLTEQIFNSISVVTTRPQRRTEQTFAGVAFRTRTIKAPQLFGAMSLWFGSRRVEVADPHRLVIDILDDPSFGGGGRHAVDIARAYWKSKHADPTTVIDYAQRYGRGAVFKRLGFTAEQFGSVGEDWLKACRQRVTAGISDLDPSSPTKGRIVSRWNLRVNIPLGDE
jgi:predicted transcriptional regulator of viral defense system